jgi:hypothetical protein
MRGNLLVVSSSERQDTHNESVEVCLGPFTCEISLGSSLRIGNIFGQERSQRVGLYDTQNTTLEEEKTSNKFNNTMKCGV